MTKKRTTEPPAIDTDAPSQDQAVPDLALRPQRLSPSKTTISMVRKLIVAAKKEGWNLEGLLRELSEQWHGHAE